MCTPRLRLQHLLLPLLLLLLLHARPGGGSSNSGSTVGAAVARARSRSESLDENLKSLLFPVGPQTRRLQSTYACPVRLANAYALRTTCNRSCSRSLVYSLSLALSVCVCVCVTHLQLSPEWVSLGPAQVLL